MIGIVMYCYNETCPIVSKQISHKDLMKPWITNNLKSDTKRRHNLYLLSKVGKVTTATYNNFRNYVTGKLRNAKKAYFGSKFHQLKGNVKKKHGH